MKTDNFSIHLSVDMFRNMLKSIIKHEHSDIISNVLVNHLDNFAAEQLYAAMHGITPTVEAHVGQSCLIPVKRACGWKHNVEDQTDNLVNDKFISGLIMEIDPYTMHPITVSYSLYNKNAELEECSNKFSKNDLIIEWYD